MYWNFHRRSQHKLKISLVLRLSTCNHNINHLESRHLLLNQEAHCISDHLERGQSIIFSFVSTIWKEVKIIGQYLLIMALFPMSCNFWTILRIIYIRQIRSEQYIRRNLIRRMKWKLWKMWFLLWININNINNAKTDTLK